MTLLAAEDLHFRYRPASGWLLQGLTFEINRGDFLFINGPSGCGKSTLLRLANRLLDPGRGTISFHGQPLASFPVTELRRRVLLTPQEPAMFEGSVEENLLLPFTFRSLHAHSQPGTEQLRRILETFRLEGGILGENAQRLSVGQRMRLAIARSLLLAPDILMLDEPLAGLDEVSRKCLADELDRRNHEEHLTLMVVSHFPWPNPGGRRVTMRQGRLEECEVPA